MACHIKTAADIQFCDLKAMVEKFRGKPNDFMICLECPHCPKSPALWVSLGNIRQEYTIRVPAVGGMQ